MKDLKEKQEARIQQDLDNAKFGMICSNEDTFKRYTFEQLDKVRKETAECVCDKMVLAGSEEDFNIRMEMAKIKKDILKKL